MKPAPFDLHVPSTVDEASTLLADHADEAKVLAGGQSLVPLLALRLTRFEHLVDVNRVAELQGIDREDGWLSIGAVTRQSVVERDEAAAAVPLLCRALPLIGHFQIRNRGTLGGSIAHADPASELPAVAVALDAELVAASRSGSRTIPASDFFVGMWTTALAEDELLTAVRFPVWDGHCGFAVEEFARRHGDFAIAGVACAVQVDGAGVISRTGIALFGMGSTPIRAGAAEAGVVGERATDVDIEGVARAAVDATEPGDDIHGSADYRRRVARHITARALRSALEEATHV